MVCSRMANFAGKYKERAYRGEFAREGKNVTWGAMIERAGDGVDALRGELVDAPSTDSKCRTLIHDLALELRIP